MWSKITNSLFRFEDDINIFRIKKNLLDGTLPIYNLELTSKVLGHLDNVSKISVSKDYLDSEINEWKPTKLNIDGKVYKAEIKIHGDNDVQWADSIKSYKIKLKKNGYVDNKRRFNLILFENRLLNAKTTRILAKELELMDIRDDIVVLKINGVTQGLYYLQERLDYTFLENNQCSNCEIIKIRDNIFEDHPFHRSGGVFLFSPHVTAFDYELSNIDLVDSELNKGKVLYSVNELFKDVNDNNIKALINHFDIDQLSSFEALRMIIGHPKIVSGDNIRMAYSATNSKFYPIAINEVISELKLINGGFEHHLTKYGDEFVRLFYLLIQDDQLRYLRNKKVYQFISANNVTSEMDNQIDKYLPYAQSYKTNRHNTRYLNYEIKNSRKIIEHNMNQIKDNFEYSKAYINVIEKGNKITLEIIPDSIPEIKFNSLKVNITEDYSGKLTFIYHKGDDNLLISSITIKDKTEVVNLMEFVEDLYFSAGLDENLFPEKRVYKLEVIFDDMDKVLIENFDISMRNDITGKDINEDDIYVQIADGNDYYETPTYFSFDEFKNEYPQFKWGYDAKNRKLTLLEGTYILDKDLIVPKINGFEIDAGVKISIAENKSILSYSPLAISGTKEKPVIVNSLEKDKPFGTFAVLGEDNEQIKSVINWLDLSGGSEKWINGIYFSGQLSIYHMNVDIDNILIHKSQSDDGINIKYSNVFIDNSKFFNNAIDQADLDFVTGVVKDSEFTGTEKGAGGDNLDLSGSMILIKNNKFSDSIDKGVSIGEKTKVLLYKNIISDNNLGVAVKDLSQAYFIQNTFRNNDIAMNNFQKKQLFGGGFSYIYENKYISNEKDFARDEKSKIYKIDLTKNRHISLINDLENDILSFP
tara:strand:- start:2857 stop:5466 length:2610 start_codon:yes stop_codon:yes gene_type:complete